MPNSSGCVYSVQQVPHSNYRYQVTIEDRQTGARRVVHYEELPSSLGRAVAVVDVLPKALDRYGLACPQIGTTYESLAHAAKQLGCEVQRLYNSAHRRKDGTATFGGVILSTVA